MRTMDNKRLAKIEAQLTPKEWGIRMADEFARYQTLDAYCTASFKSTELLVHRARAMLREKVERNTSGHKMLQNRRAEMKRTQIEIEVLWQLLLVVNNRIVSRLERAEIQVALLEQVIQAMLARAAFSDTASAVLARFDQERKEKSAAAQAIRGLLTPYLAVDIMPVLLEGVEPLGVSIPNLTLDLIAHQKATTRIQDDCFEGHGILALDLNKRMGAAIDTLNSVLDQHRQFLTQRGNAVEWMVLDGQALALADKPATDLTNSWMQVARDEATVDVLNWMCDFAARDDYRREIAKRMVAEAN